MELVLKMQKVLLQYKTKVRKVAITLLISHNATTHFSACHAVMNAIVRADRHQLQKYSIYSVHSPCEGCQRMLAISGMSLDPKNSACECKCFER